LQEYRNSTHGYQPFSPAHRERRFDFLALAYSGHRSVAGYSLDAIKELRDNPFGNALSFSSATDPQRLVQWIANTKAKEGFASLRADDRQVAVRRQAVGRIEETIASITGRSFEFTICEEPLGIGVRYDGDDVSFDVLPDGLKSILSWVADLLMRMDRIPWRDDMPVFERPFVLFLDEVEVHLHPAWQRKVLPAVQTLFPNAQLFVSTHSPFVVASARDAWIHPLRQVGGRTVVGEPISSQFGASYARILREVLEVDQEFADEVEELFDEFYKLKRGVLGGDLAIRADLETAADRLMGYGTETAAIVGRERRQIGRAGSGRVE